MRTVKVSSKNQITLGQHFLDLIGVQKGDRLLLQLEGNKIVAHPLKKKVAERLEGAVRVKPSLRGVPFSKALAETKKIVAKKLK